MGYACYYQDQHKRFAGYGVIATCDHPKCDEVIDRGISYMCGAYDGDDGCNHGCGMFFCSQHRDSSYCASDEEQDDGVYLGELCERCSSDKLPFNPKADHKIWKKHMRKHPSWAEYRAEKAKRLPIRQGEKS